VDNWHRKQRLTRATFAQTKLETNEQMESSRNGNKIELEHENTKINFELENANKTWLETAETQATKRRMALSDGRPAAIN